MAQAKVRTMIRALLLALTLTACTAQATEPAPCVLPVPMPAEIEHGAESVTSAGLEEMYGSELEGKPQ